MDALIKVENLTKMFHTKIILDNISFEVKKGEFLSVLGPSGCGKTTLLRSLIGIEPITSGLIYKNNVVINTLHPSKRGMGIVFQNYCLFPNMNVLENISYALSIRLKNKKETKKQSLDIIEKMGLKEHISKKPHQLSGGQQQRVAIARTLVLNPDIILFDEPMSALDSNNKLNLRKEFKEIQKKFNITMIYVTHDQEEAFALSNRIMIMNGGQIEQLDTPINIYHHPTNEYVASFVREHLQEKISFMKDTIKEVNL